MEEESEIIPRMQEKLKGLHCIETCECLTGISEFEVSMKLGFNANDKTFVFSLYINIL